MRTSWYNQFMQLRGNRIFLLFVVAIVLSFSACSRVVDESLWTPPPYLQQETIQALPIPISTAAVLSTPFQLPPTRNPNTQIQNPTPDLPHGIPTPITVPESYIVQPGDTISIISQKFGLRPEAIIQSNALINPNFLEVGQVLSLPANTSMGTGPSFKIIPDSELIYGPYNMVFDPASFIQSKGGYLASYAEEVDGQMLTGAQIVERIAREYSVNPKLLLSLLEYQAGWVSNSNPGPSTHVYPIGDAGGYHTGLYKQLAWAANLLNLGFYGWQVNAFPQWTLADGSIITPDATINAGTAGVQRFFAQIDDYNSWQQDVNLNGLFSTYYALFGYPFDYTIEPILPPGLSQPEMSLPFGYGETWNFTGGPHGGWDTGSAWAALDFAPPGEGAGCITSNYWVTAIADGPVIRSENGVVIQDLDEDGYEETGWTVLYLHLDSWERVPVGSILKKGDRVGHPSCEGGFSFATHLHLARRYNGMWIAADGPIPFTLDGYTSSGTGIEYDGYLTRGTTQIQAWDGFNAVNQISK